MLPDFSLEQDPPLWWAYGGLIFFLLTLWKVRLKGIPLFFLCFGIIVFGFSIALLKTHLLKTPMLHYPLPPLILEGLVTQVELKPTKQGGTTQRLLLIHLHADTPENLPHKVYVTLKGKHKRLWPGQRIRLKTKLIPVGGPILPGGFDFRRHAYFQGVGGRGFSLNSPEVIGEKDSWALRLEKRREEITSYFLSHLPSPEGSIAAALITGDKSSIPERVREDFIHSGLAHILAISGLHLTIIAGIVFMVIRRGIAIIPPLCLAFNSKKLAAIGTLIITFLYLILSGFGIPGQRAFIMISLIMGAIVLDRTALSMRTVALAAFLILLISPESLLSPSFQLSFAAVLALISGYETWKTPLSQWGFEGGVLRKGLLYGGGLVFSSLLATLATLPFTVYFFHHFSPYGLFTNFIAVPLTSLVIIPSALLSFFFLPLGGGDIPLWVFEKSIGGLVYIASKVSSWPGANFSLAHPPFIAFLLISGGGFWLCLWLQPWRRWGLFPLVLGGLLAFWKNPPNILIDEKGRLVGVFQNKTLSLTSKRKGNCCELTNQEGIVIK